MNKTNLFKVEKVMTYMIKHQINNHQRDLQIEI